MQRSTEGHGGKVMVALLGLVIMIGFGVFVVWAAINDLPAREQTPAWRWFIAGWAITVVASWLAYLPRWRKGRIVTKAEHQRGLQAGWTIAMASIGPVIVGFRLGFIGPGFGLVVGTATAGLATFMLSLVPVTLFTKKGRALRARQLAANQDPT